MENEVKVGHVYTNTKTPIYIHVLGIYYKTDEYVMIEGAIFHGKSRVLYGTDTFKLRYTEIQDWVEVRVQ